MGEAVLRGEMAIPIILGLLALGVLPCTSAQSAYNIIPISLSQGSDTEISSPGYPSNYDNNLNILWLIQAPDNYRVVATFSDVSLEYYHDNLIIGFGSGPDGAGSGELAWFTGTNYTSEVVSPADTMWIVFTSDVSKASRGFHASLAAIAQPGCQGDEFQCRSGLCVSRAKICDGYNDCLDFSDEEACPICEPVQPEICRERLAYNSTFFPHRLARSALDAESNFTEIVSGISSCHENLLSLTCNLLYPECTHNGPTHRVCYSDCVAITDACQAPFEQTFNRPWPFNCSQFTDHQADGGLCFAAEGDLFNTNICGTRPAYAPDQARVVGGINSRRGEFPWIGSLREDDGSKGGIHFCGASLIAPQWVLTAAHCVESYVDRVIFGNIRLSGESEYEVNAEVADIIAHPDYDGESLDTDIALLRLTEPVTFSDYVRPVCLATSSDELNDYRQCVVAGWGTTSEGGDIPETLRKAVVNLLDQDWCNSEDSYNGSITDNMICAGYERGTIDTCQGDSGGPLTCEGDDGRWHLVGATSFGDGCARPLFPGVYARISQFQSFITAVVSGAYLPGIYEIDLVEGVTTSITSPNYPTGYDVNDIIVWKISAPVNRSVRLDVIDLALEQDYDYLYVGDGLTPQSSTELARMTGYVGNRSVTSHGRHMWMRFVSDFVFTDVGFEVELSSVDPRDDSPIISVVDNVNPVQISSPNYPATYPPNSYDIWRIVAPVNHTVLVLILDVDLASEYGTLIEIGYGTSPHRSTILYTLTAEDYILGIVSSPNNALWIRFQSGSQSSGRGFAMQALAERLEDVNECQRDPCRNGGTCTDMDNGYQCSCLDGYKGKDCTEDNDECEWENPCFNGGTCNNGFGNFSCECPPGYTGLVCETSVAVPCESDPCLNGATCVESGAAGYNCRCPTGYTGQNCESSVIDPCQSNPCSGAASCEVYGSSYRCVCRQGFTGYNCDIDVNECSSLPCQNGGRCINGVGRYTCQCRLGYSGVNCEQVGYCDLEGEWYNDCNDKITVVKTSTGLLLGDYLTNQEILAGSSAPTVVVGYANQNKDFPTFGFIVERNNGVSTTSWSGQCQLCDGEEVLYTTWTNTRQVNTCSEIKRATRLGQDKWTRYRQEIAPRRDV